MAAETSLWGAWAGWRKHGGGGQYILVHEENAIKLYYDIAGSATGLKRNSASVSRPWQVQKGLKLLLTANGRPRTFGSKEAARKAAEKEV